MDQLRVTTWIQVVTLCDRSKTQLWFCFGGCLEQTTLEAAKGRSRAVNAEADGSGSLSFFRGEPVFCDRSGLHGLSS